MGGRFPGFHGRRGADRHRAAPAGGQQQPGRPGRFPRPRPGVEWRRFLRPAGQHGRHHDEAAHQHAAELRAGGRSRAALPGQAGARRRDRKDRRRVGADVRPELADRLAEGLHALRRAPGFPAHQGAHVVRALPHRRAVPALDRAGGDGRAARGGRARRLCRDRQRPRPPRLRPRRREVGAGVAGVPRRLPQPA